MLISIFYLKEGDIMFESLSDRLQDVMHKIKGYGKKQGKSCTYAFNYIYTNGASGCVYGKGNFPECIFFRAGIGRR